MTSFVHMNQKFKYESYGNDNKVESAGVIV